MTWQRTCSTRSFPHCGKRTGHGFEARLSFTCPRQSARMALLRVKTGLLSMLRLPGSKNCRLANHNDAARTKPEMSGGPNRAAQMLALAHIVERLIAAGAIPDYATAARSLGVTRARLTQLMNLLLLTPEIQQQVLLGCQRNTERALRRVAQEAEWCDQRKLSDSAKSSGIESA